MNLVLFFASFVWKHAKSPEMQRLHSVVFCGIFFAYENENIVYVLRWNTVMRNFDPNRDPNVEKPCSTRWTETRKTSIFWCKTALIVRIWPVLRPKTHLITRRSLVQIRPPQPNRRRFRKKTAVFLHIWELFGPLSSGPFSLDPNRDPNADSNIGFI